MLRQLSIIENISYDPIIDERYTVDDGVQISLGDSHGSQEKYIFTLKKHGFILFPLLEQIEFNQIINKHFSLITAEDLNKFNQLIAKININPRANTALFRDMGDGLGDRRGNDYYAIQLKVKIFDLYYEILSNHVMGFFRGLEGYDQNKKLLPLEVSSSAANSMLALQDLIDRGLVSIEEIKKQIHEFYMRKMRILDVSFDLNGKPTWSMHGVFGINTIKALARELNIPFTIDTPEKTQLMTKLINEKLVTYLINNMLYLLIGDEKKYHESSAIHSAIWERLLQDSELHFMKNLPDNTQLLSYKNSYILVNNQSLFFINHDGTHEKVPILNWEKFITDIKSLNINQKNKIPLTAEQILEYITQNGGHLHSKRFDCPDNQNFIHAHDGVGMRMKKNTYNLDNNLGKFSCYDNAGLYTITYVLTAEAQKKLLNKIGELKLKSQHFFNALNIPEEKYRIIFSLDYIFSSIQIERLSILFSANNPLLNLLTKNSGLIPLFINSFTSTETTWDIIYLLMRNNALDEENLHAVLSNNHHEQLYYILLALEQTPQGSFNTEEFQETIKLVLKNREKIPEILAIFTEARQKQLLNAAYSEQLIDLVFNMPNFIEKMKLMNFLTIKAPEACAIVEEEPIETAIMFKYILDFFHKMNMFSDSNTLIDESIQFCLKNIKHLKKVYDCFVILYKYQINQPTIIKILFKWRENNFDDLILISNVCQDNKNSFLACFNFFIYNSAVTRKIFRHLDDVKDNITDLNETVLSIISVLILLKLPKNKNVFQTDIIDNICINNLIHIKIISEVLITLNQNKLIISEEMIDVIIRLANQKILSQNIQFLISNANVIDKIERLIDFFINAYDKITEHGFNLVKELLFYYFDINNFINSYSLFEENNEKPSNSLISQKYLFILEAHINNPDKIKLINKILETTDIDNNIDLNFLLEHIETVMNQCRGQLISANSITTILDSIKGKTITYPRFDYGENVNNNSTQDDVEMSPAPEEKNTKPPSSSKS